MTIRASKNEYTNFECYENAFKNYTEPSSLTVENLRAKRDFSVLSEQIQAACGLIHTMMEDDGEEVEVLMPMSGNAEFAISVDDFDYIVSRPHTHELQVCIWNTFACESHTARNHLVNYIFN